MSAGAMTKAEVDAAIQAALSQQGALIRQLQGMVAAERLAYQEAASAVPNGGNVNIGPTLTVAVAGVYAVSFGIGAAIPGAGGGRVQLTKNGAGTSGTNTQLEVSGGIATSPAMALKITLAAGDVLRMVANNGWANGGACYDTWIWARLLLA